jgi:site-specific DNA-methyltransferase (adenine-specific)
VLFGQQPFTSMLVSSITIGLSILWSEKRISRRSLLANYRPMKCTEDICVFSRGGGTASRTTGIWRITPKFDSHEHREKTAKSVSEKCWIRSTIWENNKLTGNSEYTQKFTGYPNEIIEFDIEYDTIHETQKPVHLTEYLYTYSNEGDVVLDNTIGNYGIGCLNTKRRFIGIEKDETYFKLSKHRIINHA